MDNPNIDIKDFLIMEYLAEFRIEETDKLKAKRKRSNSSIPQAQISTNTWSRLHSFIQELKQDPETVEYAKLLKLELEYLRVLAKEELKRKIKVKTGKPAVGPYSLQAIADVLDLTREGIRFIEKTVIGKYNTEKGRNIGGKLNTPGVSKILKEYTVD